MKDHADTVRALAKLEGFDAHVKAVEERLVGATRCVAQREHRSRWR